MRFGWHILRADASGKPILAYDQGPAPATGVKLTVPDASVCNFGLHASPTPRQAYDYCAGSFLCYVATNEPNAYNVENDKWAATERTIIRMIPITNTIRNIITNEIDLSDAFAKFPDGKHDYDVAGPDCHGCVQNRKREAYIDKLKKALPDPVPALLKMMGLKHGKRAKELRTGLVQKLAR
jgi:hypothetical protein